MTFSSFCRKSLRKKGDREGQTDDRAHAASDTTTHVVSLFLPHHLRQLQRPLVLLRVCIHTHTKLQKGKFLNLFVLRVCILCRPKRCAKFVCPVCVCIIIIIIIIFDVIDITTATTSESVNYPAFRLPTDSNYNLATNSNCSLAALNCKSRDI